MIEPDVPVWAVLDRIPYRRCPKVPADREARVGYHIDNNEPHKKERVFGDLHQTTTNMAVELGVE